MPLQQLRSLTNPRSSFGVVTIDNTILVAGGHPGKFHEYESSNFSADVDIYEFNTDSWRSLAPLPFALQGLRLAYYNDYVYAFGGFRHDTAAKSGGSWPARSCNTILRYSLQYDLWEAIGEMPRPRSSYVIGTVQQKVYLIGGWDATPIEPGDKRGRFYPVIDIFDLQTEKFVTSNFTLPLPLRRAFSSCMDGQKIIVSGGLGVSGFMGNDLFDNVQSFDPTVGHTGIWTSLPNLEEPLFSPGIGFVNQTFYVAGGTHSISGSRRGASSNNISTFQYGNTGWTELNETLSSNRSFVEVVELPNNRVGFLGGHNGFEEDSLPVGSFEVL